MTDLQFVFCDATAAAPVNHYLVAETFGHVCTKPLDHDNTHLCACGRAWRDSERVAFAGKSGQRIEPQP